MSREAGLFVLKSIVSLSSSAQVGVTLGKDYHIRVDGKFYDDNKELAYSSGYSWRKKYQKAEKTKAKEIHVEATNVSLDPKISAEDLDKAEPGTVSVMSIREAMADALNSGGVINATGMEPEELAELEVLVAGGVRRSAKVDEFEMATQDEEDGIDNLCNSLDDEQPAFIQGHCVDNPKLKYGAAKAPTDCASNLAIVAMQNVMAGGSHKYGYMNYRESEVDYRTYIGALNRHRLLMEDGVDMDKESRQYHLAHIMSCCAILIDAEMNGMVVDNRSKTGLMEDLLDASVRDIALFVHNNPKVK